MADPDSDRRRPRESLAEERETKRVRINVLGGEESDEWVETEEEWVRIHRCPRRDLFSPHDAQDGPKLSDVSKRRESIALMEENGGSLTDGETKTVRIACTGKPVEGVTRRRPKICLMSGREARNSESREER